MVVEKKEEPIYFTMKMPEWFINLDGDEKIQVVKKLAEGSSDAHELTREELLALCPR
ncbi:MAG: hypothetical protein LBD23_08790 [Oscillospiraceae bacterium]|nr:hypothetical protein [Oscillospiraceae bacterium]